MIRIFRRACSSLLLLPLLLTPAVAFDLPAVNLGFTSFLDGGPPTGPGLYLSEYLHFYSADKLKNQDGKTIPIGEVDVQVLMNQLIYQSDQPLLFGGKWGLNLMLPIVNFDTDSPFLPENSAGLGDLLVGPYIQWDPIMGAKGPLFMHRIELQTILPTGRYDEEYALNPGSNHYSFNPYWAATAFLGPHATVSWRLHYLWNGKNNDPSVPGLDDIKPGQAWHANFAAAYEVWPKHLRLGVNGYYLNQFTRTEFDGEEVSGRSEKVLGIGPGLVWHFSQDAHLFANAYFESKAENRPEGERYNMRFVYHF